jgi:hypothetical protein
MEDSAHSEPTDELCEELVRFHDKLVSIIPAEAPPVLAAASESTVDERLRADQQCLELIERVRRQHGDSLAQLFREKSQTTLHFTQDVDVHNNG